MFKFRDMLRANSLCSNLKYRMGKLYVWSPFFSGKKKGSKDYLMRL
jgi:hypothetical protein